MSPFPYSSLLVAVIFAVAIATTLAGAVIAVVTTRLIRAVCGLMMCCVGLAGLYYFLNSPFLALMEILIYVGAVCVTIVFAVMLAEPDEPALKKDVGPAKAWTALAIVVAALIAIGISRLSLQAPWPSAVTRVNDGSVAAIGTALLTTYALAFELISLVLLVAILGALAIARGGRTKSPPVTPDALGIVSSAVKTSNAPNPTAVPAQSAPTEVAHP